MAGKKPAPAQQWVNIHGEPLGSMADIKRRLAAHGDDVEVESPDEASQPPADQDVEAVFDALCIAGWSRGRTALQQLLRELGWRSQGGTYFGPTLVREALTALHAQQRVELAPGEGYQVPLPLLHAHLPRLLARADAGHWWRHWIAVGGYGARSLDEPYSADVRSEAEATALLRLLLAALPDRDTLNRWLERYLHNWLTARAFAVALCEPWSASALPRLQPALAMGLLLHIDQRARLHPGTPVFAWLEDRLSADAAAVPESLRLRLAENRLHGGRPEAMRAALGDSDLRPVFEAASLAHQGQWSAAAEAFAPAIKALAALTGRRKGLLPKSLLQWYGLSLLAQTDVAAWTTLRKLALAESGTRKTDLQHRWGLWAHAVALRLGDDLAEPSAWQPGPGHLDADPDDEADRLILAAWLGQQAAGWTGAHLQLLSNALHAAGLPWKADLLAQAAARLGLPAAQRPGDAGPPWTCAFYAAPQAAWRDALAAITALGDGGSVRASAPTATLLWLLELDQEGRPFDLQAMEASASGRGKAKPVSLTALQRRSRLDSRDAAVLRSMKSAGPSQRGWILDLAGAVAALVGHPGLRLADAPAQAVELRETLPTLSVERQSAADGTASFVFRLEDELLASAPPELIHHCVLYAAAEAEAERRNALRVLRESPERARLIRIGTAQRRVAELISKRWAVPVDAQAELDAALRVLSGHFLIHSDAAAGEQMPAQAGLVAQLLPRGEAMELRLLARPFGDFGPLLVPGSGRSRLMTQHQGLSLSTQRDLSAERGHLAELLQALPFLGDEAQADACWLLDDAEQALAAVQQLGAMAGAGGAVRALEWPKGKPLRVHSANGSAMRTQVSSGRDWFALDGELRLDEHRVLSLQQLLAMLREHQGARFLPLGEGEYLALAEQLRQRLAELDALGGDVRQAPRLPSGAAAWLADAAEELGAVGDKAWRERAQALQVAAALQPPLPAGLRAELRPYQAEGHAWMMRLAAAGFGACLADDMGLGKTVQTLALLLDRAVLGPALVLAPTSVCANWLVEAQRFAPGLSVQLYGESEREAQIAAAGPGSLLVCSYALAQRDVASFAAREWASLVLDEAQALKNAATQRAQAAAAIPAGFRLALSGTPVENRLADLWSIMNIVNPGLLGSATQFAQRFATPIERGRDEAARSRLRRLVSPFLLRRTKAQVLGDLPPRTEIVHLVQPGAEEQVLLEALRRESQQRIAELDAGDPRNSFNVLTELTRLRRAACDPRLVAPELGLIGAKAQAFEQLAQELVAGRHKALVFSQFTDFLKLLAERLDAAGLRYQYLDGSTPAAQRAERVAAFQRGEGELFLISLKAGGFGLNLTAADYVIIADPWWNPAVEDQAMGRAHRMGQQRPVTVYRLVTAGSVEQRIVDLHHDKRELADSLLAEQDGAGLPSALELISLLRD